MRDMQRCLGGLREPAYTHDRGADKAVERAQLREERDTSERQRQGDN